MGTQGSGYEMYGRPSGMTQQQWNQLSQKERDFIKGTRPAHEWANIYNYLHADQNAQAMQQPEVAWATQGYYPQQQEPQQQDPYGGGGDSGSDGSGSGSAYLPPRQLSTSPEWLAYLNALGLEGSQYQADINRQRSFAQANADQQLAGIGPQYDQQRRGIAGNAEARGMQDSGQKLRDLSLSRADEGRARSGVQLGLGQNLAQLESQLAQKMMDLGARRADQELSLRSSGNYV